MSEQQKTYWKKNLDSRYISGEDLKNGERIGKGLRPNMVVTLAKFEDSDTFDQSTQSKVDKTALWLKDVESGKVLYKPLIMNKTNGEFLYKEIGNGHECIDDWDFTKPFELYAKPDSRHGHVARLKKHYPKKAVNIPSVLKRIEEAKTEDELKSVFLSLSTEEKTPEVVKAKDARKIALGTAK